MTARTAMVGTLLLTAGVTGYAGQGDPAPAPKESEAKTKPAAPASGAMVFIDPVTHQIRQPDASEIGTLAPAAGTANTQAAALAPAQPVLIQGPGGAVGMKLGADSLSYMVVTKTPDGKLVMECVTGDKAAEARTAAANAKQPPQR